MQNIFNNISKTQQNIIIKTINNIIEEAVMCGGDAGGPYSTYSEHLIQEVEALLEGMGISHEYEIHIDENDWLYLINKNDRIDKNGDIVF